MNNSTVNLPISESSINSTTLFIGQISFLEVSLCSINLLFGLPLHSYVIWLIVTQAGISTDFFSLNLSVCEIGVCIDSLFTILSLWFSSLEMLALLLSGLGMTGRPLFQCMICVERYLAVVHPVTFLKFRPLRYRAIFSTAGWAICLCFCFSCIFLLVSYKMYVYAWFFSVPMILVLSIKLFCCLAVLRALKQSGPGERGREREDENLRKKRVFQHILIITVTMIIIYIPFTLAGFIFIFTNQYIPALWLIGVISYTLAAFVQPVLYLLRYGKIPCFPKP
ncbi:somatostatin receptor type 1-like [Triplophysa dalaica]|uniref:somatostatin receptor type 1-like n=1 Tax=Triplophysa dalaica TaxID=1582913 RepID=UPI0024DFC03F|nr:somatostatin receptor type 1-like [Triplophysa dalaica]